MKKFLSFVPFILACCLLIGAIGWGAFIIFDTYREVERLASLPGASGVDYLGVYVAPVIFGIGVFVASAVGMIFSGVSRAVVKKRKTPHCVRCADDPVWFAADSVGGSVYVEMVLAG